MKFIEAIKSAWSRYRIVKIGTIAAAILLVAFLLIFFARPVAANDPAAINTPVTVNDPAGPDIVSASAQGEAENTVYPDLADTISDLFRDMMGMSNGTDRDIFVEDYWRWIFTEAGVPEQISRGITASVLESPAFLMELLTLLYQDEYTYCLVDKQNPLPPGYEPDDLVPLTGGASYRVNRDGFLLRREAADSLNKMAAAAAAQGIVLTVGSAYRSAVYQAEVYEREVRNYGREIADRQSAQPGKSQHQLGLVIDFAPIDDAFGNTPASQWLIANAGRFGWSISFPEGYEEVTGYRHESWHYRYVGVDLAAFINTYFEGIQQYALQFIKAWLGQVE